MASDVEKAEWFSRGRAMVAPMLGAAALGAQQWLFFGRDWEDVSALQLGLWAALALPALLIVMTGGRVFTPRRLRRYVDDDVSRSNRLQAITGGFGSAMLLALIVFVVSPFEPIDAQRAAHFIVSMGLGVSLLSFGIAEVRSLG